MSKTFRKIQIYAQNSSYYNNSLKTQLNTGMTSDSLKPTSIISLNHYIFSGIRSKPKFLEKPSRDDIYKKILIPKNLNKPKFQQKGLIFVWPQKRASFFYNKEMIWLSWFVAHALYWLYVFDILPSGTGII